MADIISFDSGLKEFDVNGKVTVCFNPTDMTFIEKVYDLLERMDKRNEKFTAEVNQSDGKELFEISRRFDKEAREELNGLFGDDVCTPLFGTMALNTIADGLPVWANFIFAVIDLFDASITAERAKTNPRIKKYTDKYQNRKK